MVRFANPVELLEAKENLPAVDVTCPAELRREKKLVQGSFTQLKGGETSNKNFGEGRNSRKRSKSMKGGVVHGDRFGQSSQQTNLLA